MPSPTELVHEGIRRYRAGEYEQARDLLEQVLAANPTHTILKISL